jgi:hypothetical protein
MSIPDRIWVLEQSGALLRYVPRNGRAVRRCLFLGAEMQKQLNDPQSAICRSGQWPDIIQAFDRWVEGGRLYVDDHGRPRTLKRLKPPPSDIWEIRVVEPRPQVRIFGRFASIDVFVALFGRTRPSLGRRGSEGWRNAMTGCEHQWKALFDILSPLQGGHMRDFVSEAFDDCAL